MINPFSIGLTKIEPYGETHTRQGSHAVSQELKDGKSKASPIVKVLAFCQSFQPYRQDRNLAIGSSSIVGV